MSVASPEHGERLAFLFPGQGSQFVGMGHDLRDASPAARAIFEEIDETLQRPLTRLMFEGPAETLTLTENAQPAITAVSLAAHAALQDVHGVAAVPRMVAGHSLGEYSALAVAGVLSVPDTIRLVVERGRLMQEACEEQPGGMVALIGIDEFAVRDVCRESGTYLSNINASEQIIISGDHLALARAIDLAAARGARKCVTLPVGGAFHSGLMAPAQTGLNEVIDSLTFHDPAVPIVGNCDAELLTTAAEVREELERQLTSCVRWSGSLQFMMSQQIDRFVEIGPGRVLSGLVKRADRRATVVNIGDFESVRAFAA